MRLAAIVAAAAATRVVHLLALAPHTAGIEDAFWFRQVGTNVAAGNGFVVPVGSVFQPGFHLAPTATHPPLYALVLAGVVKLGITGDTAQRALGVVFGSLTVLGVALLGRRAGGERVALAAAALAAISPLLIAADGALLSETLYGPTVAFTLLAAWRLAERPTMAWAVLVGVGTGLAALTRPEAVLLVVLPALLRPGWTRVAVAVACTALVLSPWVVRNWSQFHRPLISTNVDALIAQSNCHRAYHGRDLGYFVESCKGGARQGVDYASHHAGRLGVVVPVRLLRLWTLWQPFRSAQEQGRSANVQKAGVVFDYLLVPFALIGVARLRRKHATLVVLLAPVVLVAITAALTYGSVRLRHPAELSLVVLAAAGSAAPADPARKRLRT